MESAIENPAGFLTQPGFGIADVDDYTDNGVPFFERNAGLEQYVRFDDGFGSEESAKIVVFSFLNE